MITFIVLAIFLWLIFRWAFRSVPVMIEPPPPAVTILTPSITVHVHIQKREGNRT